MKIGAAVTLDERSARALYGAACAGLLVFSTTFIGLATAERVTLPWYDPNGHTWHLAQVQPAPAAMDWFGRVGISVLAAALGAALTWFLGRRRDLPPAALRAASIWSLAITVLGLFLYAWTLANRVILPPGS